VKFINDENGQSLNHLFATSVDFEVLIDNRGYVVFIVDDYLLPRRQSKDMEVVSTTQEFCSGCHMFINIRATLTPSGETREFTFAICPLRLIKDRTTLPILQHLIEQTSLPGGNKFFEREVEFGVADRIAGTLIQDRNLEPRERARRIIDTGSLVFAAYSRLQAVGLGLLQLKLLTDSNNINENLKLPNCGYCQRVRIA
jgi:hypothetical protein